jgi:glyoxalase family protein
MGTLVTGLHHVTALAGDGQLNFEFYAGVLGLRLVKKTINFDAPDVYHLYYGDEKGNPGTILTFFPFPDIMPGRKGKGQLTTTSFSISENSLDYWMNRLSSYNVPHGKPEKRFEKETFIYFEDHEGLGLELVAGRDARPGFTYGHIPLEHSIKGFYGVALCEESADKTGKLLLSALDHHVIAEDSGRKRFAAKGNTSEFVDIVCSPEILRGSGGYGTVHHVAFATPDEQTELQARERLVEQGFNVTAVIDRQYFHSIYFREPGGVLFEIATKPPGFTVDEPLDQLGTSLKLPVWQEKNRIAIENELPPLSFNLDAFL